MPSVDLNADVGETGTGPSSPDAVLMTLVTSASIACGGHAGDTATMRHAVALARGHGVAVGAHPGLADRAGFGRGAAGVSPREAGELVTRQVAALGEVAAAAGVALRHVKPHGALYNQAARDMALAAAVAGAVAALDARLILFAPPRSALARAGAEAGLRVAREGFADRGYQADGSLTPRGRPGALLEDPAEAAARAVALATGAGVTAADGSRVALEVDTLCVHGDTPGAAAIARAVRAALLAAGLELRAPAGA